jgi:hypothetical protein
MGEMMGNFVYLYVLNQFITHCRRINPLALFGGFRLCKVIGPIVLPSYSKVLAVVAQLIAYFIGR